MSDKKVVYGIGQMLQYKEDDEVKKCFGYKEIIKKDTKVFVGADGFCHYLNGNMQRFSDIEVDGFSVIGLAEYLYICLRNKFEIDEMLDDYEQEPSDFKNEIANALEELGMYNHVGNRS
ncbi:hypothetical protein K413DRAFT_4660 [Clostridium sp. ASBs410]|nr:hypothetical protein K413DRAFT_4660 [Clostridium sp. ASBs410]